MQYSQSKKLILLKNLRIINYIQVLQMIYIIHHYVRSIPILHLLPFKMSDFHILYSLYFEEINKLLNIYYP
jgi:hypothetical protein